ncbi:MAG: hypothetical protein ACRESZ_19835 [Methylococcales bacterium]
MFAFDVVDADHAYVLFAASVAVGALGAAFAGTFFAGCHMVGFLWVVVFVSG